MLDLVATLFQLSSEFLRTRKDDRAAGDAPEFQAWLREVAFAQLLAQSDQILEAAIALKAAEHERFAAITDLLQTIRRAVSAPSAIDQWAQLRPADQALLKRIASSGIDDPLCILEEEDFRILGHFGRPARVCSTLSQ
jgi:hypothetical protein